MVICNLICRNSPGSSTCWKELICQGATSSARLRDLQQTNSLAVTEQRKCLSLGSILAESFCHITCFSVPEGGCLSRIKPSVLISSSAVSSSYFGCWLKSEAQARARCLWMAASAQPLYKSLLIAKIVMVVLNSTQVKISITKCFQKLYLWAAGLPRKHGNWFRRMTVLSKTCLLFWVEFICLIENFIRRVCVPRGRDWGSKQSSGPVNNPNVWKYWVDCQPIPEKRGQEDLSDLTPKGQ